MKFLFRLVLGVIFAYILFKLGLIEVITILLMQIGSVVMGIAAINPTAALIGVVILILIAGRGMIDDDDSDDYRRHSGSYRRPPGTRTKRFF